ncbi:MAG: hypothetical protein ACLSB9_34560 [Hydrogeniiclostridium mannosilyticum]
MSDIVKRIGYAMSLRTPQKEALSYLAAISENCDYRKAEKAAVEAIASERCENQNQIMVADEFDFPSFCYHMAAGISKTRLMIAVSIISSNKGYKHFSFWHLAIPFMKNFAKSIKSSQVHIWGLEAEMGRQVFDGENYASYPARYVQGN